MAKTRIYPTVDEDVAAWVNNSLHKGELSVRINDYFRELMKHSMTEEEKEIEQLRKDYEENKKQQIKLFNEGQVIRTKIQEIESNISKEEDKLVAELEAKASSMMRSGEWEAMTR